MTAGNLAQVETEWPRLDPTARTGRTPAMLAERLGAKLARKRGAIAFSRTGNPDAGDFGDATILATYGEVDHGMLGE